MKTFSLRISGKACTRIGAGVSTCFLLVLFMALGTRSQEILLKNDSLPITRKIDAGQTHDYSIELKAQEVVSLRFEKEDLRFVFIAVDPLGDEVIRAGFREYGPVDSWFISGIGGIYHFKVTSLEKSAAGDHYKLEITNRRPSVQRDGMLFPAEKKFQQAEELRNRWSSQELGSALDFYKAAADIWFQHGEWGRAGDSFERIGNIYLIFGDYGKSLEAYKKALILNRRNKDKSSELRQYCNIARISSLTGDQSLAERYLEIVKNRLGDTGSEPSSPLWATQLNNFGEVLSTKGNLSEARGFFERALKIWQNLKDRRGQATAYQNLGYTNLDAGEMTMAERDLDLSLTLWRELEDLRGEAFILTAQGHVRSFFRQLEPALVLHSQAKANFNFIGDRQGEAVASNGMGHIFEILNRPANAIDSYDRALRINKELGNLSYQANTSFALARAYRLNGNFADAEKSFQESLELCRKVNKPRLEAYVLGALAGLSVDLGNEKSALTRFRRTISFYKRMGDLRGEALILGEIGNIFWKRGDLRQAKKIYLEALNRYRKIGDEIGVSGILYHLAEIEFTRENLSEALTLLEESMSLTDSLRAKLGTPTLRASYQATAQNKVELLIDIFMRMYKNNPRPELTAATLEKVEQLRARVLLELLNETRIELRADVDPALLKQEKELQNKISREIEKQESIRQSGIADELEKAEQAISSLTTEYDELQNRINAVDPKYERIDNPAIQLADIQGVLQKEPNTVFLSYFLGTRKSYVWLVDGMEIRGFELKNKNTLETSARDVYRLLTARQRLKDELPVELADRVQKADRDLCLASENLSRELLGQVAPYINEKRLLISLDGALQYVPFEALPDPRDLSVSTSLCSLSEKSSPYRPMLETNEISYIPSFSILNSLRRDRQVEGASQVEDKLAIWADPVYDSSDPRLAGRNIDLAQPPDSLDPLSLPPIPFSRLMSTSTEANRIAALWPANDVTVFRGLDATRRSLSEPTTLAKYRYLHISAHGLFNNERPENSGLLLSQFNEDGVRVESLLSLRDIFQLRLNADLVVLSACQSGLGENLSGEGLTGLKYGLFYAGAKSAVVSLWKVDNSSTTELMHEFYRVMYEEQLPAAAALRKAKLKIYRQSGWEPPYYWAAFTLNGNHSVARSAPQNYFSSPYVVFFIIFALLAVIFFGYSSYKRWQAISRL